MAPRRESDPQGATVGKKAWSEAPPTPTAMGEEGGLPRHQVRSRHRCLDVVQYSSTRRIVEQPRRQVRGRECGLGVVSYNAKATLTVQHSSMRRIAEQPRHQVRSRQRRLGVVQYSSMRRIVEQPRRLTGASKQ